MVRNYITIGMFRINIRGGSDDRHINGGDFLTKSYTKHPSLRFGHVRMISKFTI